MASPFEKLTPEERKQVDREDYFLFAITLIVGIIMGVVVTAHICDGVNESFLIEKGYAYWSIDQKTGRKFLQYNPPAIQSPTTQSK